jgi:predicted RNA methylase
MSENKRLELQSKLDNQKSIDERRRLGQFATPTYLAREIVSFGLSLLGQKTIRFLDPAIGTGAFYSALRNVAKDAKTITARGIEIDPHYGLPSISLWANTPIEITIGDFTNLEPDQQYNLLICNPPYVRHHLIADKERIRKRTTEAIGVELSGLAGLYCHFLLQSVRWMESGGIAGWLIPSEFMDVNYGEKLRHFLLNEVELLHIHRFDPTDAQFADALVSSATVWFRKRKPDENASVMFSYGGSQSTPTVGEKIAVSVLRNEQKWTRFPLLSVRKKNADDVLLNNYFTVKRGIATGKNSFFILKKDRIKELGLPPELFRPVLPSSRFLRVDEINADEKGNPILDSELFLLDCRMTEAEVMEQYPRLWEYFLNGEDEVANGYLCKSRKCWYHQEQREAPLFVFTYMGRACGGKGAFRFILNHSNATVTNSYLALYPKDKLRNFLAHYPEKAYAVWEILNSIDPQRFEEEGRIYGGGLRKLEPAELLRVPAEGIADLLKYADEISA